MSFAGRFAGRSAVITGGASGIGLAVGQRIVEEGGRVCVWDRDPAQIEQAKAAIAEPACRDPRRFRSGSG